MANHKSAKKRIRQSETRRVRNQAAQTKMKTLIRKVQSIKEKAAAEATTEEVVEEAATEETTEENTAE